MLVFFFFQAEDGIRDLVRSRGLGDVYKRQLQREHVELPAGRLETEGREISVRVMGEALDLATLRKISVSYTHLTLPTSDLV